MTDGSENASPQSVQPDFRGPTHPFLQRPDAFARPIVPDHLHWDWSTSQESKDRTSRIPPRSTFNVLPLNFEMAGLRPSNFYGTSHGSKLVKTQQSCLRMKAASPKQDFHYCNKMETPCSWLCYFRQLRRLEVEHPPRRLLRRLRL